MSFVAHWEYAWDKANLNFESAVTPMLAARGTLGWELVEAIKEDNSEMVHFFFKRRIYTQGGGNVESV